MTTLDIAFDVFARDKASGAFASASKGAEGFRSKMGDIVKLAAGAVGGAAVANFFKGAIEGARESAKIAAQTEAVLKSTGGAARVTAGDVGKLAESIARKTGIDDELIQTGQNLLLTFTNIRNEAGKGNDIFNQSTKILVDMAAAMGTEPKAAAIQLGKALNDPIAGVSALSRVGVTFTEDQKNVIKSLVETGDVAGAQKVILAELGKEFGGSAEAQATAADRLKVSFGNLQESVGALLVPVLEKAAAVGVVIADWMANTSPTTKILAGVVAGLAASAFVVVQAVQAWTAVQAALNVVMSANPIGLLVVAIAALIAGVVIAYRESDTFRAVVQAAWEGIQRAASVAWDFLKTVFSSIVENVQLVGRIIGTVFDVIKRAFLNFTPLGQVIQHFDSIVGFVKALPGRITSAASGMWDGIREGFRGAINWIIRAWNRLEFKVPGIDVPGLGRVGGFTLGMPDIPTLHAGGQFRASTFGGEGLALLRDREWVLTPAQMAALSASSSARSSVAVTVEINAPVYGVDDLEHAIAEGVQRGVRDHDQRLLSAVRGGAGRVG